MVFFGVLITYGTVVQALRVPPASVSVSSGPVGWWVRLGAAWDAFWAFWGASTSRNRSWASWRAAMASSRSCSAFCRQFRSTSSSSRALWRACSHKLPLAVRTQDRLAPGKPLVGQFCLEVMDRRLSLVEEMFCTLFVP